MAAAPEGSLVRRAGYVALLTVGLFLTAYGSYLFNLVPPIPYKLIPDLRALFLLISGVFLGVQAMGGSHRRRAFALYGVVGWVLVFHLEEATVHWIGPVPGSITGTRVGPVGTAGSLLMLVAIVLLHVEAERCRLRRDVVARGASAPAADALAEGLAAEGRRQAWGIGAAVAALGLLVFVLEKVIGDGASGGEYTLLVGGGLLVALALYLLRMLPGTGARKK